VVDEKVVEQEVVGLPTGSFRFDLAPHARDVDRRGPDADPGF